MVGWGQTCCVVSDSTKSHKNSFHHSERLNINNIDWYQQNAATKTKVAINLIPEFESLLNISARLLLWWMRLARTAANTLSLTVSHSEAKFVRWCASGFKSENIRSDKLRSLAEQVEDLFSFGLQSIPSCPPGSSVKGHNSSPVESLFLSGRSGCH